MKVNTAQMAHAQIRLKKVLAPRWHVTQNFFKWMIYTSFDEELKVISEKNILGGGGPP